MSRYYYMKLLILSLVVFLIFIGSIACLYFQDNSDETIEHFQGKPPSSYLDILPSSPSDLPKISVSNNTFKLKEVKRYFPKFIKTQVSQKRGALPIKIEVVDNAAMVAAAWKIADELNEKNNVNKKLLAGLQESLDKSNKMLELTKQKCKA